MRALVAALAAGFLGLAAHAQEPGQSLEEPVRSPAPETGAATPPPAFPDDVDGIERADALLQFASEWSDDPRAPRAILEAQTIFHDLLGRAGRDALVGELTALFAERDAVQRASRLEAVAATGDERAIPAVGYVARRDAQTTVRLKAIDLLGDFAAPSSEDELELLLDDRFERDEVRTRTIEALAMRRTERAGETLLAFAADTSQPVKLRRVARDAVAANFPSLSARLSAVHAPFDSSGRGLFTIGGAAFGSYSLGLVGSLSQRDDVATTIGAVGGLVIGGAAAHLLGSGRGLGQGDSLYMLGAGLWSIPVGYFAGATTGGPDANCGQACRAVMLGTHLAALGSAWAFHDRVSPSVTDNLEINGLTIASMMIMRGALDIPTPSGELRPAYALMALAPTAGFVAGSWFADRLQLTAPLAVMSLFAAAEGAVVGTLLGDAWLPSYMRSGPLNQPFPTNHRETAIEGTRLLAAGLSLGGVLAASALWQPSASDVALISYSMLAGNLLGGGLPMLIAGHDGRHGGQVAAGLGGPLLAVGAGLLGHQLEWKLDVGDMLLVGLGGAFALWQGEGWSAYAMWRNPSADEWRAWGAPLTVTSVALLGLVAGAQHLDLTAWQAGWLFSGAAWGGWLAGWGSYVFGASGQDQLASWLGGSAVGLGMSALLVSPVFDVSPTDMAWASVFGVAGATLGSMGAVFVSGLDSPGRPIATANVVGSAVGLVAGALLAPKLTRVSDKVAAAIDRTLGEGLSLPSASAMPVTDLTGRVTGAGAQFVWSL